MKLTLAIAALIGNTSAVSVKSEIKAQLKAHQLEQNEAILPHMQDVDENMEMQIDQTVTLKSKVSTRAQVTKGCNAGINRFTNGTDNTWQTFKDAHSGSALFEDQGFPADATSLMWDTFVKDKSDGNHLVSYTKAWKRPSEMGTLTSTSFWGSQGIKPNGVYQGQVGDCWFLAAASALAEVPDRLKRVVWNDGIDKNGAYRFNFWVKNKWHGVNVDDRLPVMKWGSGYKPVATRMSINGAWWMPLMEKAYAKLDQNYERIIAGMGYEGLRTLTGMPTVYLNHAKGAKADASWTVLQALAKKNFPMTTPCCHNGGANGLVSGHAYTALDFVQLSTGEKLAKVRNPWSQEMYKGPWSDSSSKWTDALRKEVGQVTKSDGIFFLPYEDYIKYYWGASVSLYQAYKGFHQENLMLSVRLKTFKVNNPIAQEFYVQAETYSDRNFPRTCNPDNNSVVYLYDKDWKMVGSYGYIGRSGMGFVGKPGQQMPAGDYNVNVVNQAYATKAADLSVMFYFLNQKGTVTS